MKPEGHGHLSVYGRLNHIAKNSKVKNPALLTMGVMRGLKDAHILHRDNITPEELKHLAEKMIRLDTLNRELPPGERFTHKEIVDAVINGDPELLDAMGMKK